VDGHIDSIIYVEKYSSIIYRLSSVRLQFDRAAGGNAGRKTNRAGAGKGEGEREARARDIEREIESTKYDTDNAAEELGDCDQGEAGGTGSKKTRGK
jgi:hypothetical protein